MPELQDGPQRPVLRGVRLRLQLRPARPGCRLARKSVRSAGHRGPGTNGPRTDGPGTNGPRTDGPGTNRSGTNCARTDGGQRLDGDRCRGPGLLRLRHRSGRPRRERDRVPCVLPRTPVPAVRPGSQDRPPERAGTGPEIADRPSVWHLSHLRVWSPSPTAAGRTDGSSNGAGEWRDMRPTTAIALKPGDRVCISAWTV